MLAIIRPRLSVGLVLLAIVVSGYMGGITGWLLGMIYGRERAGGFAFAGLKGMDATGAVGGVVGLVVASVLAGYIAHRVCRLRQ